MSDRETITRAVLCWCVLGACALAVVAGCGARSTQPESDSQAHWLKACDADDDCGGLSCLCGLCSVMCSESDECGAAGGLELSCIVPSADADCTRAVQGSGMCLSAQGEPDPSTCGEVSGRYEGRYELLSGDCDAIAREDQVSLDDDSVTIEKFSDFDLETETVVEGCIVHLIQTTRRKTGNVVQRIEGSALDVDEWGDVSGNVTLTQYGMDDAQVVCAGEYLAHFSKSASATDGAAK